MECKCAETFAAECGCGSKSAEDAPIPSDPRVSPMDDGLHIPADSPALDLPRENAEIGGVDFKADSSPLPPDPRVSPLNEGLYTPSDTPEMAAEGNSYTNYQPLPEWPPAARHIITGLSKWERDESDKYRCGPVYMIDGEWAWCNGGSGDLGHIDGGGGSGPLCSYCGMNMETGSFSAESFGAESKFDKLAKEIAEEYEEKGKSPKEAMEIGEATAAKIGRAKFGKRKFAKMGQKAESFSAPIEGYWGQTVDSLLKDLEMFKRSYSGDMPVVVRDGIGWSGVGIYDVSFQEFQTTPDKLGGDEYDTDRDEIRESEDRIDALAIVKTNYEPAYVSRYGAEDDIDFDKSKADRNKDGRISDWERAVGNAVSKGIRDHKGAESKLADLTKQDVADIGYQFLHGGEPQSWTDIWVEDEETGEMVEEGSLVDDVESAIEGTDWFSTRLDTYDEPFLDWFYNDGFSVVEIVDVKSGDEIVTPKMLQDALDKSWEKENFGAESAFDRLEDEVAEEYEEKGMSDKEAKRIGAAVAYDQGVKKYGKKIMSEAARKGVSARSLERRAEVGPHVPTRIGATTTTRGVVKTFDSIPAGDGHVVGQFTPDMDYAPSGMYGAESITDSIAKGFGSVLGIMSGLIIGGFAMNAVALLKSDDEN